MRTENQSSVVARMDWPAFDAQYEELSRMIGLLNLSPLHSIASDVFIGRFLLLQETIESLFRREEALLKDCDLAAGTRDALVLNHKRIREMLNAVYTDALEKRNRTAIEVYESIKFEIDRHVLRFTFELNYRASTRLH